MKLTLDDGSDVEADVWTNVRSIFRTAETHPWFGNRVVRITHFDGSRNETSPIAQDSIFIEPGFSR